MTFALKHLKNETNRYLLATDSLYGREKDIYQYLLAFVKLSSYLFLTKHPGKQVLMSPL
jgi:hypothetical protein